MRALRVTCCIVVCSAALICAHQCVQSSLLSRSAKDRKSLQHAKQIYLALKIYADEHDGAFPSGRDANECFAPLLEDLQTEKLFYVPGSAWHGEGKFARGPDNLWENSEPVGTGLEAGENCYAFNRSARIDCREDMPIIASGFAKSIGTYSNEKKELGGVWANWRASPSDRRASIAIVLYGDGSGEIEQVDKNLQVIRDGQNIFLSADCDFVNPRLPPSSDL